MARFVNLELLANPLNWIIVALMLIIGTLALAAVFKGDTGLGPTQ